MRTWVVPLGGGLVAGVVAGLFGVGGGILLVPILVLLLRRPQHVAHATSLVAITIPALAGSARFGLDGAVAWPAAAALAAGALAGVRIGATVLPRISDRRLRLAFLSFLLVVGVRLIVAGPPPEAAVAGDRAPELTAGLVAVHLLVGLVAGALSAMMGVGGGIIIVPALVLLLGYGQHVAEGTSLAVIVPTAVAGALRHSRHGYTEWDVGVRLGAGGLFGALLGAQVALATDPVTLSRAFGGLVLLVSATMIADTLRAPAEVGEPPGT